MSKIFRAYECDTHGRILKAYVIEADTDDDALSESAVAG